MLDDVAYRLRALFRRSAVERDMRDEIAAHLDALEAKYRREGMTSSDAARRARLEFGGVEQVAEACRDSRGVAFVESAWADVRYAARLLRKDCSFSAIAIGALALGIGAATTVFSVVDRLLLTPLPYRSPERIVVPWMLPPPHENVGFDELPWGRAEFLEFAATTSAFESVGAFVGDAFNLSGSGEPARFEGARVSWGFFPALGVAPELGRTFTADEDRPDAPHVVVLSDRVWHERFAADPTIVGRTVNLNSEPYTVVAIMPPSFSFPRAAEMPGSVTMPHDPDVWVPAALPPGPARRGEPRELAVVGRLKPGVSQRGAQADLDALAVRLEHERPAGKGWFNSRATALTKQIVGDTARPLVLMLAAVGILLTIACVNVANLLLTRGVSRQRELSLRAALGAERRRLVRQLVTESLLLAVAGAAAGVLVAAAGVRAVAALGPEDVPMLRQVSIDSTIVLFSVALALVTGILFGLAPAVGLLAQGGEVRPDRASGRVHGAAAGARLRRVLLTAEVALALVLVVASGLLVRTFAHLITTDGGFRAEHAVTFELTLPPARFRELPDIVRLYRDVLDRLRAIPGVQAAGLSETVPLGGNGESTALRIPDVKTAPGEQRPYAAYTIASPGYFNAVGTPILRGRDFLPSDSEDAPLVAIINRAMAEKFWPGRDPIGRPVGVPIVRDNMTVVGIVPDVKHQSLRETSAPEVYVPFTQRPWPSMLTMHVAMRGRGDTTALISAAREAVRQVDAELPLASVAPLTDIVDQSIAAPRFLMLLLAALAGIALLLAAIGLYGAVSYAVAQRTPELGVRIALGAARRHILATVLGESTRVTCAGIALGVGGALATTRVLSAYLYGVEPSDPVTFAGTAAALVVVSLVACYVPARRATRLDPIRSIRAE